ncbi:MAG TPA: UDP-3-O-acyl-N-acetylglucosamine deacetylase [Thermoanaerobaculia bacterium]|nr:UDP-3-O-acyl-N-acetylglucosamine deacetylase [Thermoanaerobaculia bacterium]
MKHSLTIGRPVRVQGIGLHTGRHAHVVLHPAEAGHGIVFVRTDVGVEIPAVAGEAARFDHATTLGQPGCEVGTVEHLLSALVGMGIYDLLVEVDGPELPILDGSATFWLEAIRRAGLVRLGDAVLPFSPASPISVPGGGGKRIEIRPARDLRVTYTIDFAHPAIGRQSVTVVVTPESYAQHIAPARTFGFLAEYETLKAHGLARGASPDNCIVVGEERVESGRLRFPDEFVRHKALDLVGDLALVGRPVLGHVVAHRAGHALHTALARRIREELGRSVREGPPAQERVRLVGAAGISAL